MERKKLTFIAFFACLTVASAFAQSTKVRLETDLGNITIQLFDDLQQRGMVRGRWNDYIRVASTFDELTLLLSQAE